jgi:hypothetical protein
MKKFLFLGLAVFIAIASSAQNNQPAPLLKARAKTIMDDGISTSNSPLKLTTLPDAKGGIKRIPFGSSLNMLTLLEPYNNNCVYNADLGIMMFTHRAGGVYGGVGGDMRCHFTTYFGTNIDSVVFLQQNNNRMRYPNGVIYNPTGNTTLANAMAIISGPCTDGTNWNYNFFCTQKLDGSSLKYQFEPVYDTLKAASINLTVCDGGKVKAAGKVAQVDASLRYPYFYYKGGQVQGDSVVWDANVYPFKNTYQDRLFSNDTTYWAFSPYLAFSKDGMTGYFYVMGLDAADDAINSGPKPIVWKTIDGGTSWTKLPLLDLSTLNAKISPWIKPTRATLYDTINPVYRPGIMSGATVEESNMPGIVDMDGNLHIACNIEGMYSSNIDSLDYTYQYNLWNMFDLYTTSTGWDINLVDTIHSHVDKGATFSDENLDHSYHVARNADATKIFFMWTDTDLDTANYMPDIHAKAFDLVSGKTTASKKLTFETDYILFNASQDVVDSSGTFFMPATFAVLGGSTGTIDAEPTHCFVKGLKFTTAEFEPDFGINDLTLSSANVSVNPNPAKDFVNINFNLTKAANVKVTVYNILGTEVLSKSYGKLISGDSKLTLNTSSLNSGIYFFTIQAGNDRITKKIIVE